MNDTKNVFFFISISISSCLLASVICLSSIAFTHSIHSIHAWHTCAFWHTMRHWLAAQCVYENVRAAIKSHVLTFSASDVKHTSTHISHTHTQASTPWAKIRNVSVIAGGGGIYHLCPSQSDRKSAFTCPQKWSRACHAPFNIRSDFMYSHKVASIRGNGTCVAHTCARNPESIVASICPTIGHHLQITWYMERGFSLI